MEKDNGAITQAELTQLENDIYVKRQNLSVNIGVYETIPDQRMKDLEMDMIREKMEDVLRSLKDFEAKEKLLHPEPNRDDKIVKTDNPHEPYDNGSPDFSRNGLIYKRETGLRELNAEKEKINNLRDSVLMVLQRIKTEPSAVRRRDMFHGCLEIYGQIEARMTELLKHEANRLERLSGAAAPAGGPGAKSGDEDGRKTTAQWMSDMKKDRPDKSVVTDRLKNIDLDHPDH